MVRTQGASLSVLGVMRHAMTMVYLSMQAQIEHCHDIKHHNKDIQSSSLTIHTKDMQARQGNNSKTAREETQKRKNKSSRD